MDGPLRSKRMTTGIERVFRHLHSGLYREIYLHYIHFLDDSGTILSSKLDKSIEGKLYRRAQNDTERSRHGELEYQFPDEEHPVRMLAMGHDLNDFRYGRH
jgi:hypothetical protein